MGKKKKGGDKEESQGNPPKGAQQKPEIQQQQQHPAPTQQPIPVQNPAPQQQSSGQSQQSQKLTEEAMKGNRPPNEDIQPGPSKDKSKQKDKKMAAGDWMCPSCNNHNFAKKTQCNRCKVPKPTDLGDSEKGQPAQQQHPAPTQQPIPVQNPAPQQQSSGQSQQPQKVTEEAMKGNRPPNEDCQPGPSKDKSKQKDKKMAAGDWMCPSCNNHNFAKKKQCNKCKVPKPTDLGDSEKAQPVMQAKVVPDQSLPSMQNLRLSPTNQSKQSSSFMVESSAKPSEYEGKKGKKCELEVNYGKISLDPKKLPKEAFQYDVVFDPETPKKFLPFALEEFMRQCFANYIFASDNRKNIYTASRLEREGRVVDEFQHEVTAHMGDRNKVFKVKIKLAGVKDMSILMNYTNPKYQNEDKPMNAIQALDIILRKPFRNVQGTIQVARGLYFAPREIKDLGDGMELWYGLFQSAIMGRSGIFLNVDILHKAFPSAMPLLHFVKENLTRDNRLPASLDFRQQNLLSEHLKMLTIGYRLQNEFKTYGFNELIDPKNATFTDDSGRQMTVAQYYQQKKGIRLQFPNMPYLWVGSKVRTVYLPLEFCEIPAGQATNKKCSPQATAAIIKFSATSTIDRKAKIRSLLSQINYQTDPVVTGFGINVDKNFQKIEGRVIEPPKLKYSNGLVTPIGGAWNGKNFIDPAKPLPNERQNDQIKWCIVNCDDRTSQQNLMDFKKNFMNAAKDQNVYLKDIVAQEIRMLRVDRTFQQDIERELETCLNNGYRLVVVIVVDKNDCYGRVKQAAELKVGILTQCIRANTIFRMGKGNPMMTIKNILLKVNAKLNGKNHEIEELSYKNFNQKASGVMFVGADVTHPSPDQRAIPSVVGVASSYDDVGFRYCCGWRLQDPKKEMIEDLAEILIGHLHFYFAKNKCLPGKILYYRDGVSDGQFNEVLAVEMTAINKAVHTIYGIKHPHPKITFIVVQKRHHTRFFPTQKEFTDGPKFQNIVPGTVVDKNIVHPFQYQFFMASHAAIQGVTKPSKYCVLVNESKISPDDLQAITYDLCHLFTRCNRSVSYPAPTYYAHLVAARGKNYFAGDRINLSNLKRENQMRVIRPAIVNNAPMFFV